jgi:hypothetical protein
MPIRNMWFDYKLQGTEVFLSRAFDVDDEYLKALDYAETEAERDHAFDMLLGYQDIVYRAVYSELNSLVELELKELAKSILGARRNRKPDLNRGRARTIIEEAYGIKFEDLPGFAEVDGIRRLVNAYKHDDGFSGRYEEVFPNGGWLFGYRETRYELDWDSAYRSVQAVGEFMRALPGDRQQLPETRYKVGDEATLRARREAFEYLNKCGALGHNFEEPTTVNDERGGYVAKCRLCGESVWNEHREMFKFTTLMGKCPGMPGLRKKQQMPDG